MYPNPNLHPARTLVGAAALASLLATGLALGVSAQSASLGQASAALSPERPASLTIMTDYPSVMVMAGEEARFPLTVTGPVDERVDLAVEGVPDGFAATLRGGDEIVSSVYTQADTPPPLELRVRVPEDAAQGTDELTVSAVGESGRAELPIDILVGEGDAGSVSLTSKYPVLSGDSEASFSFDLKLQNDTAKDITFGLQGTGPDGWNIDVRPSGQSKAATALVPAGSRTNIKVTADPPRFAPAGRYLISVTADGDSYTADAQLGVEITGSYAVALDTPDGRLNTTVEAGGTAPVALLVTNTGTAPLGDLKMSARTPKGWEVSFDPETIPALAPTNVAQVKATIKPASNSVAGDYALTLTSRSPDASDDIQLRTTVETSTLWGFAAVGIIALAAGGLFLVFRRYGRR